MTPPSLFLLFAKFRRTRFGPPKIWKLFSPRFSLGPKIDPAPQKSSRALHPILPLASNQIAPASKCVDTPPMFSNVFFCPTCFVWPGTFGIRSMRFAPSRLLPCHHQITSNHVLRHARKNIQKTPKVKNSFFFNHEKTPKYKKTKIVKNHENLENRKT